MAALLLLFTFSGTMKGQRAKRFFRDGPGDKYFVGVSCGTGTAYWNSKISSGALYDTLGAEMFSGNLKFKARNNTKCLNADVLMPVGDVRLGMGMCFEEVYLETIKINSSQYLFSDKFRFEKMYAQIEIPLSKWSNDRYSFNVKTQAGYYGFSYINHIGLFGMENTASVLFMNTGILADYKVFPHMYAYIHPLLEYKYFCTSASERPSIIVHKIFSYGIQAGFRFDVSRE